MANNSRSAQSAYPTANDQPALLDSIVVFLDSLGTKATGGSVEAAHERLLRLYDAVVLSPAARILSSRDLGAHAVACFTDNVVIGVPIAPDSDLESELGWAIALTSAYQLELAVRGVFVRGAIIRGPLWMGDHFVFGNGLTDAYRREQVAVYPRVILSDDLVNVSRAHLETYSTDQDAGHHELITAPDGQTFVNYLLVTTQTADDPLVKLSDHRAAVLQSLEQTRLQPGVFEKFTWLAAYHNWFCRTVVSTSVELWVETPPDVLRFAGLS